MMFRRTVVCLLIAGLLLPTACISTTTNYNGWERASGYKIPESKWEKSYQWWWKFMFPTEDDSLDIMFAFLTVWPVIVTTFDILICPFAYLAGYWSGSNHEKPKPAPLPEEKGQDGEGVEKPVGKKEAGGEERASEEVRSEIEIIGDYSPTESEW